MELQEKYENLKTYLKSLGSVAVAYSGGVDSAFLLKAAHEALADKAIAVTVRSCLIPRIEISEAEELCRKEHIRHIFCDVDPLSIDGFSDNPPERCYLCKRVIFKAIGKAAAENDIKEIAEGSNLDDNADYRPGMKAVTELGIKSPLQTVGFTKKEIREMAHRLGISVWNKPSMACLASRFVYGEKITCEGLQRVDKAERILSDAGFLQFRVRVHGNLARIEVVHDDFQKLLELGESIYISFRQLGFTYITMDLRGYRTGSMNETLSV